MWPISTLTYMIVPTNTTDWEEGCDKMKTLYEYVRWILEDNTAADIAKELSMATMPVIIAQQVCSARLPRLRLTQTENPRQGLLMACFRLASSSSLITILAPTDEFYRRPRRSWMRCNATTPPTDSTLSEIARL